MTDPHAEHQPRGDRREKLARLVAVLDAHDAPAIAITSPESLSWLLDGARVTVPYGGPAVCSAVVERDGSLVVTTLANEAARLRDEELAPDIELRTVAWHEKLPAAAPGVLRESIVAADVRRARAQLLPLERERYERLGADVTRAVGAQLRKTSPDEREHDLAARLAAAVVALGAEPVVVLVAGEARSGVQHPLPTAARIGRRAMAVVGARRHGLVVNLTRWVSFGVAAPEAERRLREVEADAFAATRPGRALNEVLADIAGAYERHGLGRDAWLLHHQGGPTGYLGRDPKATPETTDRVVAGQAFAWNPWVRGAKLEDTVIIDEDRVTLLTTDAGWPCVDVRGLARPLTLDLA